jgi:hypothetical protein
VSAYCIWPPEADHRKTTQRGHNLLGVSSREAARCDSIQFGFVPAAPVTRKSRPAVTVRIAAASWFSESSVLKRFLACLRRSSAATNALPRHHQARSSRRGKTHDGPRSRPCFDRANASSGSGFARRASKKASNTKHTKNHEDAPRRLVALPRRCAATRSSGVGMPGHPAVRALPHPNQGSRRPSTILSASL